MSDNWPWNGKVKNCPRVIVQQTLIGGFPDVNARKVYVREVGFDQPVAAVNSEMRPWSAAHARELEEIIMAYEASP